MWEFIYNNTNWGLKPIYNDFYYIIKIKIVEKFINYYIKKKFI